MSPLQVAGGRLPDDADGPDLSKYQQPNAMDGFDIVILNVEDPGYAEKAHRAVDEGIPHDAYKWIFPGTNGAAMLDRAQQIIAAAAISGRQPAVWADYEEAGVDTLQLLQWSAEAEHTGWQVGVYEYLYLIGRQGYPTPELPLWLAYYPGANDGSYYPAMSRDARAWGAKIHQYSSGGGLDVNVVLDYPWASPWFTGTTPAPGPAPAPLPDVVRLLMDREEEEGMKVLWDPNNNGVICKGGVMYLVADDWTQELTGEDSRNWPTNQQCNIGILDQIVLKQLKAAGLAAPNP